MFPFNQTHRNFGKLLATGQLTSYAAGDDGALRKGIVKSYTVLTLGQYAGNTNIVINSKTDVHANACVFDNNTGLMWSRISSVSVGPASDGKLPWTTTGAGATAEGIFPYCAAANAAGLAGYSDWRVPNDIELLSLRDMEAPTGYPDSAAFPSIPTQDFWSSTTVPSATANADSITMATGGYRGYLGDAKTTPLRVILVRG